MCSKPAVIMVVALCCAFARAADPAKELQEHLKQYLALRKKAVSAVPKLKDKAEPEEIAAHKRASAEAIRKARSGARQGEIFTPAVASYLKQAIRAETAGKAGEPARKTAKQGNPATEGATPVPVQVNAVYPEKAPLSSVPPDILLRLPQLPKELEFRFVGKHLILHDADARLILDFVPDALP